MRDLAFDPVEVARLTSRYGKSQNLKFEVESWNFGEKVGISYAVCRADGGHAIRHGLLFFPSVVVEPAVTEIVTEHIGIDELKEMDQAEFENWLDMLPNFVADESGFSMQRTRVVKPAVTRPLTEHEFVVQIVAEIDKGLDLIVEAGKLLQCVD